MIKKSLLPVVLMTVVAGFAAATPLTQEQAAGFKKGATASCIKSVSAQTGKRFTAAQINSYCTCHAGKLAKSFSLEELQGGKIGPKDPRVVAANKACLSHLGSVKK